MIVDSVRYAEKFASPQINPELAKDLSECLARSLKNTSSVWQSSYEMTPSDVEDVLSNFKDQARLNPIF